MAYLNDRVLDNGLTVLDTEANRLDICSQEPTTYTHGRNACRGPFKDDTGDPESDGNKSEIFIRRGGNYFSCIVTGL